MKVLAFFPRSLIMNKCIVRRHTAYMTDLLFMLLFFVFLRQSSTKS